MKTSLPKINPAKFFNKADPRPYINMSFRGEAGSGKSQTAAIVAAGIFKNLYKGKGGIVLVDTENSAKYLRPALVDLGGFRWTEPGDPDNQVFLLGPDPETGAMPTLADVCAAMEWMHEERIANMMLIDSLTTIHREFATHYRQTELNGKDIRFQDYPKFKERWREEFSFRVTTLRGCHFWTGRLGSKYDIVKDDDSKKDSVEFVKIGNKMAGDTETEYEADITMEMRSHEETGRHNKRGKDLPAKVWRSAVILKSRFAKYDGMQFNIGGAKKGPDYQDFRAVIEECIGILPTAEGEAPRQRFANTPLARGCKSPDEMAELEKYRDRITAVVNAMVKQPGANGRADILFGQFGIRSDEELSGRPIHDLKVGFDALKAKLKARGNGADKEAAEVNPAAGFC